VVGADNPVVAQAEAAGEVEVARQGTKIASRLGGAMSEALVVIGAEAIEHGVGLRQSNGAGEAKFADQTVLKGAPGALDTALGLRRTGRDLGDAELVEGASKLGGRLFSGEFFGERPVRIVALEMLWRSR
jgi:hypothetical protein